MSHHRSRTPGYYSASDRHTGSTKTKRPVTAAPRVGSFTGRTGTSVHSSTRTPRPTSTYDYSEIQNPAGREYLKKYFPHHGHLCGEGRSHEHTASKSAHCTDIEPSDRSYHHGPSRYYKTNKTPRQSSHDCNDYQYEDVSDRSYEQTAPRSYSTDLEPRQYERDYHGSSHGERVQAQRQTFRSAQASKQMVLEVYGNCITMLEELESREMRQRGERSLPRSEIYLPSQSHHDDSTIERKLDTQLLLLQTQLQSCDREIKDEVRKEMEGETLKWVSGRDEGRVKHGQTDKYAGKLYEVIHKGEMKHPDVFYKPPTIGETDMRNAMQAVVIGSHKRDKLDQEFRSDSEKKAQRLRLRPGSGVSRGAERMLEVRPDLQTGLQEYTDNIR